MIRRVGALWLGVVLIPMCVVLSASERVPGAALVEASETVESVMFDLARLPLERSEIEMFLRDAGVVLDWAMGHGERWREADEAKRRWT